MRISSVLTLAAVLITCILPVPPSRAATSEQVQNAIDNAVKYVYSRMRDNNWEIAPSRTTGGKISPASVRGAQWGGISALATYALLAAGQSPQDPRLMKAIEFLRTADMVGTYAVALRAQVWLNIPKTDLIREAIAKDAKLLLLSRRTASPDAGEFGYLNQGPNVTVDHSNSQYGVLGLWACSDTVEGIPDGFWAQADASWRSDQAADGSWSYQLKPGQADAKGRPETSRATMTAAGIATLFITQSFLRREQGLECSGNIIDKNIDSGLQWMSAHFADAMKGQWSFYGLYGVERIGVASGYKYFGTVDWYERGADFLVKAQNPKDGSFAELPKDFGDQGSLINTCFAILFLSRGRAPVVMNKLDYQIAGAEANWNERPRDVFNLARWIGKETENDLNWQVTSIQAAARDWHDAPILYLSGNQVLAFTPAEKAKLKAFVEEGGMILGTADCGKKEFADSFRHLGAELFPSYEFGTVPQNDVIMHDEQFDGSKWKHPPVLLGLSNGARYLMLLIPAADPGRAWQMEQSTGKEELFQLGANIYLYAVDKNGMFVKGDTYIVDRDRTIRPVDTINVARIVYEGNWNPEPGGWKRLDALMHNQDSLDIRTTPIDPAKQSFGTNKIAHLTGTQRFRLPEADITAIQQFIKDGGTLIVDGAGGKGDFAESAQAMLQLVFGTDASQLTDPLPLDSTIYTTAGPLGEIRYRNYAHDQVGTLKQPRLRGITQNGRLVCVYSPEDLSVGLVGQPVDGIVGYTPNAASELMRKALLLASGAKPVKPTPQPTRAKRPSTRPKPAPAPPAAG
jgi:hypothetical protein